MRGVNMNNTKPSSVHDMVNINTKKLTHHVRGRGFTRKGEKTRGANTEKNRKKYKVQRQ